MKKSTVFILLCCLLMSSFSTKIYAQADDDNFVLHQFEHAWFEFVYNVDPVHSSHGELIGAQISVTNMGMYDIDQNIIFRGRVANFPQAPLIMPDAEEVLELVDMPLRPKETRTLYLDFTGRKRGNKVIIIWPVIE